jgi:hypothetical protein
VSRIPRTALLWLVAALITAVAVLAITGGDGSGGSHTSMVRTRPVPRPTPRKHPPLERHRHTHPQVTHAAVHKAVAESKTAQLDPAQRAVTGSVREYVAALNERDGKRACALFVPGALADVHFPRDRGDCASSLSASVGYRDPRGMPVYRSSRVARIPSVSIDGAQARVTATVVTEFADNREPSVEDDVIYLDRTDGRWLIAKPSATLYRAIGVGDIPPQVLAPPANG